MSIFKSYFSKNNTIIYRDKVNTAKNPVTELFYGLGPNRNCIYTGLSGDTCQGVTGFTSGSTTHSRFIFDVNLDDIQTKVNNGCINLSAGTGTTHTLKMVNTSFFDDSLLNDKLVTGSRRATSFKLNLFKSTGITWDEGTGYDRKEFEGIFAADYENTYSTWPSHWFSATTLTKWNYNGVFDYGVPSSYTLIDSQTFDNGNENIAFDMTTEINDRLTGGTIYNTGVTYVVAFERQLEQMTGLTEAQTVGFFTKYTQTFYEPYVESEYDCYVADDRNQFYLNKDNKLYLYVNPGGIPTNLDSLPLVTVYDCDDVVYTSMTATNACCGVYYIDLKVTGTTYGTPSLFSDQWSNLTINSNSLANVTNEFTLLAAQDYYQIGPEDVNPKEYGYSIDGIKMDEKMVAGDTRKVFVSVRKPYTVNHHVVIDNLRYRIYVKQGTTEVEVIPWSRADRTYNHNYFLLNTEWMIPNEYFIDVEATSNQQVNTYRKVIKFQVVNQL